MKNLGQWFVSLVTMCVATAALAQPVQYVKPVTMEQRLAAPPATKPLVVTPQERARSEERLTQDKAHVPVPRGMPELRGPVPPGTHPDEPPPPPPGTARGDVAPPPPGTFRGDAPPLPPGSRPGERSAVLPGGTN